ncbi:MAG TPA: hypothetical protein VNV65_02610 [Candidatus Solibacter sp.]|nr:hypothetical protein [Candidatus Solibacter sp.]
MSQERTAGLDDQEDIAEEIPAVNDRGASDPKGDGRQPSDAAASPEPVSPESPETPEESPDAQSAGDQSAPRLYRLRPPGLRPVRRTLHRHGLRNDCPPDRRIRPRSPFSRNRLR